jgi:hypothetical protein
LTNSASNFWIRFEDAIAYPENPLEELSASEKGRQGFHPAAALSLGCLEGIAILRKVLLQELGHFLLHLISLR